MKPPFRKVKVVWLDAFSEDEWVSVTDYKIEDHVCETQGYLVKETDSYVLISPTVAKNGDGWDGCALMGIPRGCIVKPLSLRRRK